MKYTDSNLHTSWVDSYSNRSVPLFTKVERAYLPSLHHDGLPRRTPTHRIQPYVSFSLPSRSGCKSELGNCAALRFSRHACIDETKDDGGNLNVMFVDEDSQ